MIANRVKISGVKTGMRRFAAHGDLSAGPHKIVINLLVDFMLFPRRNIRVNGLTIEKTRHRQRNHGRNGTPNTISPATEEKSRSQGTVHTGNNNAAVILPIPSLAHIY